MEMEQKKTLRGELALLAVVLLNSFGVVLMLYSGSGISAISSVPYGFSEVFPAVSLGTWTYLFQGLLIFSLMLLRRKFVPAYLLSFLVGFAFSMMLDVYELGIGILPASLPCRGVYFFGSYLVLCFGVALSNRCRMPIIPTDLFPRELSAIIRIPYPRVKITFDVTCLTVTALLTYSFLGGIRGLGIGTIAAAFTMGKTIGVIGDWIDRRVQFVSCLQDRM